MLLQLFQRLQVLTNAFFLRLNVLILQTNELVHATLVLVEHLNLLNQLLFLDQELFLGALLLVL